MSDLIDTTEMYLRTIYELLEEGVPPLRARIAERLHQSGPTVSQTVSRMERDGLLVVEEDRTIRLTRSGVQRARAVMRKHRLAECLLTDVIGLDWEKVHDEACRWEHVISVEVEQRLVEILNGPEFSPYGNPIPGLKELGVEIEHTPFRQGAVSLAEHPEMVGEHTLVRMSEHLQAQHDIIEALGSAGLRSGAVFRVQAAGDRLELAGSTGAVQVPGDVAELLFVAEG